MKRIKLPTNFTLEKHNNKGIINVLNKFTKVKNQTIEVDFSELTFLRKGDFIVLLAQIEKSIIEMKNKVKRINSSPKNYKIRKLLIEFDNIFHINRSITKNEQFDSEKDINTDLIDSQVINLKKIGIKEYYYPFNVFLTELIGNAAEHGIESKKINWWLTNELIRREHRIDYTFVDMGLGIVNSHKKAGLPFRYFFKVNKDRHIVIDSLFGKLGSSTKQSNRGRGLQQLRDMVEKEIVSNFTLITNSVSLHFEEGMFRVSKNPNFTGTYFSWSIDKDNYLKWKNSELK